MVYFRNFDDHPTFVPFNTGLLEKEGRGLVSTLADVRHDAFYIRTPGAKPWYKAIASIVICTLGRPGSLDDTLKSLAKQTFWNFEVILITEAGDLSRLRDLGLRSSRAPIVSFIDDDVYCEPTWLQSVLETFKKEGAIGVSGPTIITTEYQKNRDCLKYEKLRKFQEWLFDVPDKPGTLSSCGAPSMASNFEASCYEGPVDYLECCNMSVGREAAIDAGGFDLVYKRTSEWCEVDLALKLRQRGRLIFSPRCKLYHRPSKQGVYKARLKTRHRWDNFVTFQRRWIRPSFRRCLYWCFVWTYLCLKEMGALR